VNPRLRNTAALLGVTGIVAQSAGTETPSGSAPQGQPRQGPDLSALAEKLGVSESKLQNAMEATRPEPGQAPSGDPSAALAQKLGVSEAKVRAAMQSLMPQGAPPSGQPPQGVTPS
jgi:hypothetical protein